MFNILPSHVSSESRNVALWLLAFASWRRLNPCLTKCCHCSISPLCYRSQAPQKEAKKHGQNYRPTGGGGGSGTPGVTTTTQSPLRAAERIDHITTYRFVHYIHHLHYRPGRSLL